MPHRHIRVPNACLALIRGGRCLHEKTGRDYPGMLDRADTDQYSNFDAHENERPDT
jgi:hypothetical protein